MRLEAKAVILAMGCRERPRGALAIPGFRPAGIYTAGTAQRLVNIEGYMPGKRVVILGSGDIGLIMARRLTLEGARVLAVAEVMPYSGGLKRNIVQCLEDFQIPLLLSHTVVDIRGKKRVESVVIAEVDEDRKPVAGTEVEYLCDTLLLSVGLLPENELSRECGVRIHPVTGGPVVNESFETDVAGIFACGNVLHVHDLVDFVSEEAARAGRHAAEYVRAGDSKKRAEKEIPLIAKDGVRYTVPSSIRLDRVEEELTIRFRVGQVFRDCYIAVYLDEQRVFHRKRRITAPGEMQEAVLRREQLQSVPELSTVTVCMERE